LNALSSSSASRTTFVSSACDSGNSIPGGAVIAGTESGVIERDARRRSGPE
jgi:hypothetical protein